MAFKLAATFLLLDKVLAMKRWYRRTTLLMLLVLVGGIAAKITLVDTAASTNADISADVPAHASSLMLDEQQHQQLVEMVFDAARNDDYETVHEFLQSGFSPNIRNARGDTLLIVAAYHDSNQVVNELLSVESVDLEARNGMGLTAVAAAAFKGFTGPLQQLIDAGADVNASNGSQQTALMFAALAGKTQAIKMLLRAGADARHRDRHGNTARSVALVQGAKDVLQYLPIP